jgi:hypothetical protein
VIGSHAGRLVLGNSRDLIWAADVRLPGLEEGLYVYAPQSLVIAAQRSSQLGQPLAQDFLLDWVAPQVEVHFAERESVVSYQSDQVSVYKIRDDHFREMHER